MQNNTAETAAREDAAPILDRPDVPPGFWNRAWPMLALAVITALAVRACLPSAPVQPSFDAKGASKAANEKAISALAALPPDAPPAGIVEVFNLAAVNFAARSAGVPTEAHASLERIARAIERLPAEVRVEIAAHTDGAEAPAAADALSQKRADAVIAFLAERGVPAGRLVPRGYGSSKPVADNATDEGRFRNRRVEFSVAQP
ncbi:MAG TPA: OmpA family protein [Burkholderiaceae bacterium]|nr:OmpA family protein [Burkholderiaceae bacterium]